MMRTLLLVIVCAALLEGCGQSYLRYQGNGDIVPCIVFCTSTAAFEKHVSQYRMDEAEHAHQIVMGSCNYDEATIYLLTESADYLTVEESIRLTHELMHWADRYYGGSMWALLKAMGFNQHPLVR